MRSVPSDDLTLRARIRDAAIALFGRDGFERTTVRAIAEEAGASPALVIHHFGSKEKLRQDCDEYIVGQLFERKSVLATPDANSEMRRWLADIDQFRPWLDYLARMLVDDGPGGDALFRAMLDGTRAMIAEQVAAGAMRDPADTEMTAAMMTAYGIAPLLVQRRLARAFGSEQLSAEIIRRMTLPTLEIFTHGLFLDDRILTSALDALGREPGPRSDKGENTPNQDPDPPSPPS